MSLIILEKNGVKYFEEEINISEDCFDYFEQEWFDKNIFTYDLSTLFHPLSEARTKFQQETGQREMNKIYSQPIYQLHKYLLDKWNKPKSKEEYIRKNIEFKIYNEILKKVEEDEPSEEEAKKLIKYATGKENNIRAYNGSNIGTQISQKTKMPYLLVAPRISNYLNGFAFNDNIDSKKLFEFAIKHEYGHAFEYLKDFIEKGSAMLIDTLNEKDRSKVIDSEGKANNYALKNMYRKDRRELLKNAIEDTSSDVSKEYVKGTNKYFKY